MSTGNPHLDRCEELRAELVPAALPELQAEATLAVAFELRTANLLTAFVTSREPLDLTDTPAELAQHLIARLSDQWEEIAPRLGQHPDVTTTTREA